MKRLRNFLSVCSFLVGCNSIPMKIERPDIEACVIDAPANEAICGFDYQNKIFRVSLKDLDKATVLRPREWEELQNYLDYIRELEVRPCD